MSKSFQRWHKEKMLTLSRYEQLTLRANTLREELHTEIEKMLNDIIKFKVHVQRNLEDYEGLVVDEAEQDLNIEQEPETQHE